MDFESNFPEAFNHHPHEHYTQLCALFPSGGLTEDEHSQLSLHLAKCESCTSLLQSYCALAKSGVALLAPLHEPANTQEFLAIEPAKARLLERIAADKASSRPQLVPHKSSGVFLPRTKTPALFATAAALVLMAATASFSYRLGQADSFRIGTSMQAANKNNPGPQPPGSPARSGFLRAGVEAPPAALFSGQRESSRNEERPSAETGEVQRLKQELKRQEAMIAELQSLQAKFQGDSQQRTATIAGLGSDKVALAAERDALGHKLQETQIALETAQQRLQSLQEEHNRQLLRTAGLQTRVDELSTNLREAQEATRRDEGFLASDRDIRDLMGARELYIADVFDIDREGKARKPFGRVFYTGGKSLLFYAFDLDREPGVREASTFQVWGRRGPGDKRPLSMGILYEDSSANRRWVLRFDDPKVLAEIDAVFVTVEPRGKAGHKPTGRQLLFASLRTPPNHP